MRQALSIAVFIAALGLVGLLSESTLQLKDTYGLSSTSPFAGKKPGEFVGTVLLGGFRNIAIDMAWLQALKLQERQEYYKMLAAYTTIALLQPNLPIVWEFNSHNMAFNVSVSCPTPEEQELWVRRGIEFLREGIERNPHTYRLYQQMAYIYTIRVLRDEQMKASFMKRGENPLVEALKYWQLASAQQDAPAPVLTQQVHVLVQLWRFDEAERLCFALLTRFPEWEVAGLVYRNRFEDYTYDGSVPFLRHKQIYLNWKEMD
ncbi:MAG: hypothetical protein WC712_02700 [Candidatus Brocadiia bacterium]